MAAASKDKCPCGSAQTYAACCGVFHRGEGEAPTPEALMRSRYSAFAKRDVAYLMRTLHSSHPDLKQPPDTLRLALRAATSRYRYVRLDILDTTPVSSEGTGRVLFFVELYESGKARSFYELSDFAQENGAWKYVGGEGASHSQVKSDPRTLDIQTYLEQLRASTAAREE